MNSATKSSLGSLMLLLFAITLITSCLEMNKQEDPEMLLKKWKLVRIEETARTVAPPLDSIQIWVEFSKQQVNSFGSSKSYRHSFYGFGIRNSYVGGFNFENDRNSFNKLVLSELITTYVASPTFETYYFSLLPTVVSYVINNDTLILTCTKGQMLIFKQA